MDIVGDLIYAALIGLLGFGVYRAMASGLSKAARRIAVGLVTAAIVFSLVFVSWDIVDGTSTSTESLIVLIAGVPLLMALATVKILDRVAHGPPQRHT
jgi:hypothetical protein